MNEVTSSCTNELSVLASRHAAHDGCQICQGRDHSVVAEHEGSFLIKCRECGTHFVSPLPNQAEVLAHFQESELDDAELLRKFERNREGVLAQVASYLHHLIPGGRILDVGCATGLFLRRFFGTTQWEAWGIDLNPAEVRSAQTKGVRAYIGTLFDTRFESASFDIVSVLDAFYYFRSPQQELSQIRRILKPQGVLVIEVPLGAARIWGASTRLGQLLKGRSRPLLATSDHLYYFTPRSLSLLLERCGFRVDAIRQLPGNQQEGWWRRLLFRAYCAASNTLYRISFGTLLMGPRFFIVARKEN